jgi:hypothetical protein
MTERDTLQYLRNYGKKVEENESKLGKLEESVKWDPKIGLQLKGPVYYSNHLIPTENGKINIGSVNHFVNHIYLAGKIIYPDALDFGVNHDFCIDKMGKIGFHANDHLDGVTIKGLPSFTIQNVPYVGDGIMYFEMEKGSISDFVNCQDILGIDGIYYQVLEIIKDKIRISSLHQMSIHMESNKHYDVIIYNTILGLKTAKDEDFLKINAFGDIFYKTMERNADINLNGEVFIKNLKVNEITLIGNEPSAVIPNLNAEFLCGKRAPLEGELVSTKDRQELWNKNFGNDVGMTFNRILDVGDPIHDMDAANKRYVDRYLSGLKIAKSVACIATESFDADYDKITGKLHLRMSDSLKSNTIVHIFDDYKLQINERILLINQANKWQNGVYQVVSDGIETNQIILQRTGDFCDKKSSDELKGYYTFVRNGKKFGNTGFVFEFTDDDFIWNESPVRFHIFSKMENCGGINGIKRIGNHFSLSIDDKVLKIEDDKLSIQPGKISNHYLENKGIHILPEGGIDIEKQFIQLGDHIKLGLRVNKKQFKFGKNGELQLANHSGGDTNNSNNSSSSKISANEISSETFAGILQIYPPKRFEVTIQYSDDFFEKQKNIVIQYYICSLNGDGKESNYRASDEYYICDDAKSIFANLDWEFGSIGGSGYVIYRRINSTYSKVRMTHLESSILDVIIPRNFSKIDWQPTSSPPPTENQTKIVVNQLGIKGDNFITSGKLGIGTVSPKSGLHVKMNDIIDGGGGATGSAGGIGLCIEGNDNTKEMLRMISKGIKNARITGENGEGRSMIEMGKNIKLTMGDEEGVIYLGRDENAEDKNINRKMGSDDFVVQIQDGSIYSAGEIMAGDGKPFSSYNNKLGNNAAIMKTGCVGNSIGNQVAFAWEGDQLHAVPFNDGNMLTKKKVQVKNFTIQHPIYPGKYLVHACLEGATADVYYRGRTEIQIAREFVNIKLPDYYCHIVEPESSTIQLTPIGKPFAQLGGEIFERENIIRVYSDGRYNSHIPFYWEIKGKRKGTDFKVEPEKDEVEVKQWGPYTYMDGE